jgi:hypothetical protein
MPTPVIDLAEIRREREAKARADALLVSQHVDELVPNRTYYEIWGANVHAVQGYINSLMAEVESFGCGSARFIGPRKIGGVYVARGVCVVTLDYG